MNVKMDYTTDFPKLPDAPAGQAPPAVVWGRRPPLSANERASRSLGKQFGNVSEEQQKCNQIAAATGTRIELGEAKDHSLTILITGKRSNVEDARARLVRELQTQSNVEVVVPKDYHGHIIEGSRLRQLEKDYLCKIFMPGRDEKSDIIRVAGPKEYIADAARRIKDIGDEMVYKIYIKCLLFKAKQGNEAITIPHRYYPWIRGPFNQTIDQITSETQARINIPPSNSKNETIVITGEREGVERAAAQIRSIYESKKDLVKSITINVPISQHRYIVGTRRSGIEEILRETDVIVEVPPEEEESNTVTLYGIQSQLVEALSLVYAKANSCLSMEIKYPEWMRRLLIGPKGATLQTLVPNQEKLKLEFEEGGVIYLEGPADVVKNADNALRNEIKRLEEELSYEKIKVPPTMHRHIIGKNGALINKLKNEHGVQISIPNESSNSDEIIVEGKKEGVQMALSSIQEIVKRLENEKPRETYVEVEVKIATKPEYVKFLIGREGANVKKLWEKYPTVRIVFPKDTDTESNILLVGKKEQVEAVKKQYEKKIADLEFYEKKKKDLESLITHTVTVDPRFHPQFSVEIHMPRRNDPNPNIVTIAGKSEESVNECIEHIRSAEEDFISEMIGRGVFLNPNEEAAQEQNNEANTQKIEITGAPWQLDNFEQFPSMGWAAAPETAVNGESATTTPSQPSGVWGARRW